MKYAAYTTTLFCLALVVFALSFVLATVFANLVTLGGLVIDPSTSFDPTGERFDPAWTTQAHLETVLVALGLMAQGLLGVAGVITVLVMLGIAGLCLTGAVVEQAPPMPEPGAQEEVNESSELRRTEDVEPATVAQDRVGKTVLQLISSGRRSYARREPYLREHQPAAP